jgi:hypothetical protein
MMPQGQQSLYYGKTAGLLRVRLREPECFSFFYMRVMCAAMFWVRCKVRVLFDANLSSHEKGDEIKDK